MNLPLVSKEIAELLKKKQIYINTEANYYILAKDLKEKKDVDKTFFVENSYELDTYTYIDDEHYMNVYHVLSMPNIYEVLEYFRVNLNLLLVPYLPNFSYSIYDLKGTFRTYYNSKHFTTYEEMVFDAIIYICENFA
jgi:hypothetical protein